MTTSSSSSNDIAIVGMAAHLPGAGSTQDYWTKASAKPHMRAISLPALALNALNDPFIPGASLPTSRQVSQSVTLWQPDEGGHVGFPVAPRDGLTFPPRSHVQHMPREVATFLAAHL